MFGFGGRKYCGKYIFAYLTDMLYANIFFYLTRNLSYIVDRFVNNERGKYKFYLICIHIILNVGINFHLDKVLSQTGSYG